MRWQVSKENLSPFFSLSSRRRCLVGGAAYLIDLIACRLGEDGPAPLAKLAEPCRHLRSPAKSCCIPRTPYDARIGGPVFPGAQLQEAGSNTVAPWPCCSPAKPVAR